MKIDSIIHGKPLTCFDLDLAKQCFGMTGYFTNNPEDFEDIDKTTRGTLKSFDDSSLKPFLREESWTSYSYFLPADLVGVTIPFNSRTFMEDIGVGRVFTFRRRDEPATVYTTIVTALIESPTLNEHVTINGYNYTFHELYKEYDLFKNDIWVPFGHVGEVD